MRTYPRLNAESKRERREMNWNQDNTITKAMGGECYTTASLTDLFTELQREEYYGLSLGLIIDLIRRDAERVK